jgi:hypothetical protein
MLKRFLICIIGVIAYSTETYADRDDYSFITSSADSVVDTTAIHVFPVQYDQPLSTSDTDSIYRTETMMPRRPWRAAWQNMGINAAVWSFDYFVLHRDFCGMSLKDIRQNFKTGFVWDFDDFPTNLKNHPYHGALYFSAARNNGLNFWHSSLYSFGGSLVWEFFSEREPAAINDILSTGFGGMAIGETTVRMGRAVLDDSKRGMERFAREALEMVFDPIGGFNRILHGDSWRVRHRNYLYRNDNETPLEINLSAGCRFLSGKSGIFRGDCISSIDLQCNYGDFFHSGNHPFDAFQSDIGFSFFSSQPIINRVNISGKIISSENQGTKGNDFVYGMFQHFIYYDSKAISNEKDAPYHISEAASFGPGLIYRWTPAEHTSKMCKRQSPLTDESRQFASEKRHSFVLTQNLFANVVLLGGCKTDHFGSILRDYNLGSGFSVISKTDATVQRLGSLSLNLYSLNLFTWKGYTQRDLDATPDLLYLNTQGDKGSTWMLVVNPALHINISRNISLQFEWTGYFRRTHYSYFDNHNSSYYETKIGLAYSL